MTVFIPGKEQDFTEAETGGPKLVKGQGVEDDAVAKQSVALGGASDRQASTRLARSIHPRLAQIAKSLWIGHSVGL